MEKLKILVTGASGFIGSFLCEEGLKREMEVWAGMRKTSSRKWLQNEWLKFQTLDLSHADTLRQQLSDFKQKHGKWETDICDDGYGAYNIYKCSVCGSESVQKSNYCRDCGAKMS